MKKTRAQRLFAMAMAAAMVVSLTPVTAFAENGESSGVVSGGSESSSSDNGGSDNGGSDNGSSDNDGSDNDGSDNGGSDNSGSDNNSTDNGSAAGDSADNSADGAPSAPAAGETPVAKEGPIDITISIPSAPDDPETGDVDEGTNKEAFGAEVGTAAGDIPDGPDDEDYDYEVTTQQGSVTVTTNENEVTTEYGADDLDYVASETVPTEDNDLYAEEGSTAPEQFLPGYEQPVGEETEAYEFVSEEEYLFEYVGTGNTSQFRPAVVFTESLTDEQKVEQYGEHYQSGAYIHEDWLTKYFVDWLEEEDRAKIPPKVDGEYVTDEDGYLLDVDGNRVLKNEWTTVGPDGKTYYLHRFDKNGTGNYVEGWYQDGTWVEDLNEAAEIDPATGKPAPLAKVPLLDQNGDPVLENGEPVYVKVTSDFVKDENGNYMTSYGAVWAGAQQFVLVDKATGEVVTVYCADIATKTQDNFGYNMVNLEDSTYYSDEQAEQIRAIAVNGYWGTASGEGSLDAMKEMLKASGQFSEEELASLTDGVALTATQMAIWSCSNHMAGTEFVNSHYGAGNVPADKEDEVKLMFRVYEYLKGLDPVSYEGEETTADTIINADNFLKGDMEITVLEKAEGHENNQDNDDTNDAYTTNLSFALVVTPSTENGDELVVSVVSNGQVLASGCIAGEKQDMYADENGSYTFKNIVITEGNQEFNITMEGVQNLKEGVYLYTSEIRNEGTADEVSSQTMVGMANGDHEVKVSQHLEFSFEVEDEKVVVRERRSKGGKKDKKEPPKTPENPPAVVEEFFEEDVPMSDIPEIPEVVVVDEPIIEEVEIGEGDVILSDIPKTGDPSMAWLTLSGISGLALMIRKRK